MKTLISYAYYETMQSIYNLKYFIEKGIQEREDIDYIIVINGFNCQVNIPKYKNCKIISRENKGYDFGAHYASLKSINLENYNYFIFLNSGVIGPILKEDTANWVEIFTNKIDNDVKLVGISIFCTPLWDDGGEGPKVEGFFFCTDTLGVKILLKENTIFFDHPTKYSAIINAEYRMSKCILSNNYNISCMLSKYKNIDWKDRKNWNKNFFQPPTRYKTFYGNNIDPYEVIFHKWFWKDHKTVNFEIINENFQKYIETNKRHLKFYYSTTEKYQFPEETQVMLNCNLKKEYNYYFSDPFPGKKKYLKIVDDKYIHYSKENFNLDINYENTTKNKKIHIVYFINCLKNVNWIQWLINQMNLLIETKLFEISTIYIQAIVNENDKNKINEELEQILNKKYIIDFYTKDSHEYFGLKKVWEIGQLNDNENDLILYFHSKGITRSSNYVFHDAPYNKVISEYKKILNIFDLFPSIDKVGIHSSKMGWIWYNFWWARCSYIKNVECPIITERRHYYEDWLSRKVKKEESLFSKNERPLNYNSVYDLSGNNVYQLFDNVNMNIYNMGTWYNPENNSFI